MIANQWQTFPDPVNSTAARAVCISTQKSLKVDWSNSAGLKGVWENCTVRISSVLIQCYLGKVAGDPPTDVAG